MRMQSHTHFDLTSQQGVCGVRPHVFRAYVGRRWREIHISSGRIVDSPIPCGFPNGQQRSNIYRRRDNASCGKPCPAPLVSFTAAVQSTPTIHQLRTLRVMHSISHIHFSSIAPLRLPFDLGFRLQIDQFGKCDRKFSIPQPRTALVSLEVPFDVLVTLVPQY